MGIRRVVGVEATATDQNVERTYINSTKIYSPNKCVGFAYWTQRSSVAIETSHTNQKPFFYFHAKTKIIALTLGSDHK